MRSAAILLLAVLPLGAAITQSVKVEGGQISGVPGSDPTIVVFKGIPYAAPPVGDLRWRAPRSVVPWQGVKKADQFGNSCIQNIVAERKPWTYEFMTHNEISEDCLYLNVWTERNPPPRGGRFTYTSMAAATPKAPAQCRFTMGRVSPRRASSW